MRERIPKSVYLCKHCGAEMLLWPSQAKTRIYCSMPCSSNGRRVGTLHHTGYLYVQVDGKSVAVHRRVMAKKLGRELRAHETVHHINGDRLDNSPDNLELWSSRHGRGQRVEDKIAFCKSFLAEYESDEPTWLNVYPLLDARIA